MTKYLPFDISIYEDPAINRLSTFQRGVIRLVGEFFWKNGYEPPENDYHASMALQINLGQWKKAKIAIAPALDIIMPKLISERAKRNISKKNRIANLTKTKRQLVSQIVDRNVKFSDSEDMHTKFTPISSNPIWNEGKHDPHARKAAKDAAAQPERPKLRDV